MSLIISTADQINKLPSNTSSAKFLWSFKKEKRFKKTKPQTFTNTIHSFSSSHSCTRKKFYTLPSVRMRRTCGFGYGQKYDFTQGCKRAPPPNRYTILSKFAQNKERNIGKSFGLSRQAVVCGSWKKTNHNKKIGPGSYPNRSTLNQKSYSIRMKTLNICKGISVIK